MKTKFLSLLFLIPFAVLVLSAAFEYGHDHICNATDCPACHVQQLLKNVKKILAPSHAAFLIAALLLISIAVSFQPHIFKKTTLITFKVIMND